MEISYNIVLVINESYRVLFTMDIIRLPNSFSYLIFDIHTKIQAKIISETR